MFWGWGKGCNYGMTSFGGFCI